MTIMPDFQFRDYSEEILDDFDLSGQDLHNSLEDLEWINRMLGGNALVLDGLKKIIRKQAVENGSPLRIADIGCGGGDVLRAIYHWGKKTGYDLELHGYDANPHTLNYARSRSSDPSAIQFKEIDIIQNGLEENYDIILLNLFLHHFSEDQIIAIIKSLIDTSNIAILINDLHRHPAAYYSFLAMTRILNFSPISRNDGALSVLKAFTYDELDRMAGKVAPAAYSLEWKWAFRYQLILFKN
jgi:2-polyprenyl-3-methyl-5-hydroxy-6-metoxy-1,4-benzoquinol methylase